jgi:hypothetical protein
VIALAKLFLILFVAAMVATVSTPADAASCTVNGTVRIEPMDQYYCDTDVLGTSGCSSWNEVNLDRATGSSAKPFKYVGIVILYEGTPVGSTWTNSAGQFSTVVTLPGSACSGKSVVIQQIFARVHEDFASFGGDPPYRFFLTGLSNCPTACERNWDLWYFNDVTHTVTFTSNTATYLKTFAWTSNPSEVGKVANIFYTLSRALEEVVTWSSNLDNGLLHLRVGYDVDEWPSGGGVASPFSWSIILGGTAYHYGSILRHELGHIVHFQTHGLMRDFACQTPNFGKPNIGYQGASGHSCEYHSEAFTEGIATFFGVRSITSNDTGAFACGCGDLGNKDTCSDLANLSTEPDGNGDWIFACSGSGVGEGFVGVGDDWSNGTSTCTRVRQDHGCNCSGSPCSASFREANGFRNIPQVVRYLWDMIDDSDEGGDDTNLGVTQVVAALESMPCTSSNKGLDGSCHEQATSPCDPSTDGATAVGSRDRYGLYDLSELLAGSQSGERTLNCVSGAPD